MKLNISICSLELMEETENCDGNGNPKEHLMCSSPTVSKLSLISSNHPVFSCILTLYILILLYFPQSFSLKILFIFSASLLLSLPRIRIQTESKRIVNEVGKTEFSQHELKRVGLKSDPDIIIRSFEEFFVESDVGAPLEVIFEGFEGEGEEYLNEDCPDPTRVIERQPSLSLYYPESDSDSSSSSEMDFSAIREWNLQGLLTAQFGPQQLKYITVLRDSSACFSFSFFAVLETPPFMVLQKPLACFDDNDEDDEANPEAAEELALDSQLEALSAIAKIFYLCFEEFREMFCREN
ncbi:hypothetical protein V6N11_066622 [Hibiscus sabdariffa]|uniref:Uncharacterized protein n=1 Tax=Hibiscus sabdariffa TaxID=183260 RepID=A0ABR1ZUI3_9ROSI